MTPRERILAVLHGELPDRVPVCPDISNMVPARMTGLPFWDVYLYQKVPLWKAYITAVKHFGIDGGFELYDFGNLFGDPDPWEPWIVHRRDDGSFFTQRFNTETGAWARTLTYYTADNPPGTGVDPAAAGLPAEPSAWEPVEGITAWPTGMELWQLIRKEMGDHGVVGMPSGMATLLVNGPDDIYAYFDDPKPFYEKRERMMENVEKRLDVIAGMEVKPDFLFCGASGSLVWQTPETFRELVLPVLKRTTELAKDLGLPTHVHSCGPEAELVKMAAQETELTVIDPLEIPPMGDCDLAELKRKYGDQIVLKGNLHTTGVMLRGSADEVRDAARRAIIDAGSNGGFILSTGDQCGRDTPDENLFALVDAADAYGRYR